MDQEAAEVFRAAADLLMQVAQHLQRVKVMLVVVAQRLIHTQLAAAVEQVQSAVLVAVHSLVLVALVLLIQLQVQQ